MTVQTLTTTPTEADLEARIDASLRAAFPWLNRDSLRHQIKFAFKFGHKVIEVDGTTASAAQARADILVFHDDEPLAVLELKREGIALTAEDNEQGLSYARMLHPRAPLVVVTNGSDLVLLETHSGQEWNPDTRTGEALAKLFEAAGKIAASDLDNAVEVLMGPGSRVWMPAVRAATETVLTEMTGRWEEFDKPFVDGFLIPREATDEILRAALRKRITIVEGAPLSGKSSVLRDFALGQGAAENVAVLFIEADSHGGGIVGMVADILADALGWRISTEDARSWLVRMSRHDGPTLILAVDGVNASRDGIRKDIEDLSGTQFGDNLRLVIALDDAVTPLLTMNESRRKATNIGRRAAVVKVDLLTTGEFKNAARLLSDLRIAFTHGAHSAVEFRVPWILRSLIADVTAAPQHADDTLVACLPPLLGPEVLRRARERFDDGIRHSYRALAEAVMKDTIDSKRLPATVLQSMETFAIRRKTVKEKLGSAELASLIGSGYAKESVNADQDTVIVARLPELLASEIALLIAEQLGDRMDDPESAVSWFVERCSRLPLGDIVGAQALFDLVSIGGSIPLDFIGEMLRVEPQVEKLKPGMKLAMGLPDGGRMDFTVRSDGRVVAKIGGRQEILDAEDFEGSNMYGGMDSWMILAHLAGHPFVAQDAEGTLIARGDPMLLSEVGTAPMALRRPVQREDMNGVLMHDIGGHGAIVCHEAGIVEPITWSIYLLLSRDGIRMEDWLDEAVERNSLPLLARIDIALRTLVSSRRPGVASWAGRMLTGKIGPAIKTLPPLH